MSVLYKTKYGADIILKVKNDDNETHFTAHKFVLKMSSQVLESIMNSDVCLKNKEPSIIFTNVDEEAFGHFIKYLYTSTVTLTSTTQAIEIFRIADKFNAPELAELCYNYIENHLDPSNVMACYMFSDVHGMEELKMRCLMMIQNDTKQVVNNENITKFDVQSLIILLNQPALSIRDFELFKLIERWIKVCEGSELCHMTVAHNPAKDLKKKFHHLLLSRFRHMSVPPEDLAANTIDSSKPGPFQTDQRTVNANQSVERDTQPVYLRSDRNEEKNDGNEQSIKHEKTPTRDKRDKTDRNDKRNERNGSIYGSKDEGRSPPPNVGIQPVSSVVPKYLTNKLEEKAGQKTPRS